MVAEVAAVRRMLGQAVRVVRTQLIHRWECDGGTWTTVLGFGKEASLAGSSVCEALYTAGWEQWRWHQIR